MDAKHTPGPWAVGGRLVIAEKYGSVCAVDDGQSDYVANARLIAAAPELLAALKAITDELGVPDPGYPAPVANAAEIARAAIAKAEGGQP